MLEYLKKARAAVVALAMLHGEIEADTDAQTMVNRWSSKLNAARLEAVIALARLHTAAQGAEGTPTASLARMAKLAQAWIELSVYSIDHLLSAAEALGGNIELLERAAGVARELEHTAAAEKERPRG